MFGISNCNIKLEHIFLFFNETKRYKILGRLKSGAIKKHLNLTKNFTFFHLRKLPKNLLFEASRNLNSLDPYTQYTNNQNNDTQHYKLNCDSNHK
jgi:hypothetical protein